MAADVGVTSRGLAFRVDGPEQAPAVLFCNALGCTLDLWAGQAGPLARSCRVIRFDTRGHGESRAVSGEYTMDQLGADALEVLDAVGVASAYVCGISLGGLVAMWLGIHAPARVRGLMLANTAARIGTVARWTDRIAKVRAEGVGAIAEMAMTTWFTPAFRSTDPETIDRFRQMLAACPTGAYLGCCAALRDVDLREDVSRIATRVLVVAGRQDSSTTVADAEFLCESISGATLTILDCAHLSNVECGAAFTQRVEGFLASQGANGHVTG